MRTFYFRESEAYASVRVLRRGNRSTKGQVKFTTEAGTAHAGVSFVHRSGVLEFLPGEKAKEIEVKLIQNVYWNATQEFRLLLSDPEGVELSRSLKVARCKIVDDDTFPNNKYEKQLKQTPTDTELPSTVGYSKGQASPWGVIRQYIKVNFRNPVVRCGSIKLLLKDQVFNCIGIAQLFLFQYLVDGILLVEGMSPQEVLVRLCVVALIILACRGVVHFLTYRASFWRVGGASRKFLMANILETWLAYDVVATQELVPPSMALHAIKDSATDLVDLGYMQIFPIVRDVVNLIFLFVFQAANTGLLELIPMVLMPACMLSFMRWRSHRVAETLERAHHADNELGHHASRTFNNLHVLRDFAKKSDQVERFGVTIDNFNNALVDKSAGKVNDMALPEWLGDLLVALYVIFGGYYLVTKAPGLAWIMAVPQLGGFQASLSVFRASAASLKQIYTSVLSMQEAIAPLQEVVSLLNLEIEDLGLLTRSRHDEEANEIAWSEAMAHDFNDFSPAFQEYLRKRHITRPLDTIPIEVRHAKLSLAPRAPVFDISFNQGEMVAVAGYQLKSGKTALLHMLAGWVKPVTGSVFIPIHLNVIHVPKEPVFFSRRSLLHNLCFGLPEDQHESSIGRVQAMLARFGFNKELIDEVASEGKWLHRMSDRQRSMLCIIRALIAEPDVLLLHYPLYLHEAERRVEILAILREYVDHRGFLVSGNYLQRSPCTCIFTVVEMSETERSLVDRVVEFPLASSERLTFCRHSTVMVHGVEDTDL
eukprot:TRINITY_DN8654_c0_g1_i1.p1 TRINITY_DN8654_c0_g1~~TRINITY_DN8654_c0_g1_i1.p1  ORF type:complete len:885 (-),score=160.59 TRINITY_DN8654_c0_g1_i1:39-2330(-)